MMPHGRNGATLVSGEIDASYDDIEYNRKASHLQTLIQSATGNDLASFPSPVQHHLDTLARTGAILGLDDPSPSNYLAALSKLSSDQLQLKLRLIQLKKAEEDLRLAIALARHRQGVVASWAKSVGDPVGETASLERQKKSMMVKAKEYQQELNIVASETPPESEGEPNMTSLLALQDNLRRKDRDLKVLKARLKAFEGLPPNLELAKLELASARGEEIRLTNIREKLLGRMTQGLS